MFQLGADEQIVAVIHRHWFVISSKLSLLAALLIPPIVVLFFMNAFLAPEYLPLALFFIVFYINIVLLFGFIVWADFYLDMWIVTTKRVLDIEQRGLFSRSISEFLLNNVQDVSVSIPNFFATIFKYGDVVVQTAGESSFSIRDIPRPEQIKDVIMRCHEEVCRPKTPTGDPRP